MTRLWPLLCVLSACLVPVNLDPGRYACVTDADCLSAGPCVAGHCSGGSAGGGGSTDAGPMKPGADNTGVPTGTVLTAPAGELHLTTDGMTLENCDVTTLTVEANNVTVRRCRIHTNGTFGISIASGATGAVFEDCDIGADTGLPDSTGIEGNHFTARRINFHNVPRALQTSTDARLEASWFHPYDVNQGSGQLMYTGGGTSLTLIGNVCDSGASGTCVFADSVDQRTSGLVLDGNWFNGGGYTLQILAGTAGAPQNSQITNNQFGRRFQYGAAQIAGTYTASGNTYDDGTPLSL